VPGVEGDHMNAVGLAQQSGTLLGGYGLGWVI
jgi:hypothetical protein